MRWKGYGRVGVVTAIAAGASLAACGASPDAHSAGGVEVTPSVRAAPPLTLSSAIRKARDLGPVAPDQPVHFSLSLVSRDEAGLNAQLATGRAISAAEYATRFGPDPAAVRAAQRLLNAGSLTSTWHPGEMLLTVAGPASAAQRFLGVSIHNFLGTSRTPFYAPLYPPAVPQALANVAVSVTGLDDYSSPLTAALLPGDTNGFTPKDAAAFYDIQPLYDAHLDGTGQTVVFIEWAMPTDQMLQQYAAKFTPTHPLNVQVITDAADWGAPFACCTQDWNLAAGEAALDVENVHGVAPGATEVAYVFSNPSAIPLAIKAIAQKYPHAILSSSIFEHWCENESGAKQDASAEDQVISAAAAQGMSIFWAAGDRGAYGCLPNYPKQDAQGNTEIAVVPDPASPGDTSVGGTVVFLGPGGTYYQEGAWGEPSEQWGGGGGTSTIFSRPAWQNAPGIPAGMQGRGIPDVSADADSITGWDVIGPGDPNDATKPFEAPVGGTSAAAPFWAAITALIDQDLAGKGLPLVGFANPALYTFAQSPAGLPAPPFHDVTLGSNLHFAAGPGWDFATGLGTPDVAALTDDFEWYEKAHGTGS
ncbi:MAG TPA: S53 family peptidase [Pseudonocardiaceae bacterium]|nr:S53 family peptidase [Pseudonocardiaceae bacterium]